jgi:hypothetical protein
MADFQMANLPQTLSNLELGKLGGTCTTGTGYFVGKITYQKTF